MQTWAVVFRYGGREIEVGGVEAPDEDTAIESAIESLDASAYAYPEDPETDEDTQRQALKGERL